MGLSSSYFLRIYYISGARLNMDYSGGASGKNLPTNAGDVRDTGSSLGREDPLEEGTATHSNILAWRIPWTEELGGLQSLGSQRVDHD